MTVEKAAEKVLGEAQAPMHYTEITEEIQNQGLWKSGGETPPQSVNGCLNTKIRDDPENCLWERVGYRTGMFRLKRPASRVKTTHGGGSRQQPNRKTRGASFARSIAKSAIKRGTRMKDWEEFLKKCDSEVRRYFGKAKTLAEKAGDRAPIMPPFLRRVCWGYGPVWTGLQTPVGAGRRGSYGAARCCSRAASAR